MSTHTTGEGSALAGPGVHGLADPGSAAVLEAIRRAAQGRRKDFKVDPKPIARGGQATVFGAVHKATGLRVAYKRRDSHSSDALARMRREVEAARRFGGHPHVLPVLDWSRSYHWFVMPLADGTASALAAELSEPTAMRALVTALCEALREPHKQDWVHRDLKPDNVLLVADRWVIADWGLGRRPRGQTTDPRRTQVGIRFGTEGFAAPELGIDAHAAGPQADIFSIGQIIGWALTGDWPRPNLPLLPPPGPWRAIVEGATVLDPNRRIATVDDLLAMVAAEFDAPIELAARDTQLAAAAEESTARRWLEARRGVVLSALIVVAVVLILVAAFLNNALSQVQDPASNAGDGADSLPGVVSEPLPGVVSEPADSNENVISGLPSLPSELANSRWMQEFIEGWDNYPGWSRCRSGSGDTVLTGSFPAHKTQAGLPVRSSYCTNDGNLTVMFADYRPETYSQVVRAYLDAAPPADPVASENTPPLGLHVFAWSPAQRAIVWTDAEAFLIGVVVTDSPGTDLVELWSRYRSQ